MSLPGDVSTIPHSELLAGLQPYGPLTLCTADITRTSNVKFHVRVLPLFDVIVSVLIKITDKEILIDIYKHLIFPCCNSPIHGTIGELTCFVHYSSRMCYGFQENSYLYYSVFITW